MTMKHELYMQGEKFVEVTAFGETNWVSEYKVMHSNAGYYIGRAYYDVEFEAIFPYDREGGYFKTREKAEHELRIIVEAEDEGYTAEDVLARLNPDDAPDDDRDVPYAEENKIVTNAEDLLKPGEIFCNCGNIIPATQVICSTCLEALNNENLPF